MKKEKQKLHVEADNISPTQAQHIEFCRKIIICSNIGAFPKHITMLSDIWLHHLVVSICRNCISCVRTPWSGYKEQSSKWSSSSPELTLSLRAEVSPTCGSATCKCLKEEEVWPGWKCCSAIKEMSRRKKRRSILGNYTWHIFPRGHKAPRCQGSWQMYCISSKCWWQGHHRTPKMGPLLRGRWVGMGLTATMVSLSLSKHSLPIAMQDYVLVHNLGF